MCLWTAVTSYELLLLFVYYSTPCDDDELMINIRLGILDLIE